MVDRVGLPGHTSFRLQNCLNLLWHSSSELPGFLMALT